jgi:hypothetical protein
LIQLPIHEVQRSKRFADNAGLRAAVPRVAVFRRKLEPARDIEIEMDDGSAIRSRRPTFCGASR